MQESLLSSVTASQSEVGRSLTYLMAGPKRLKVTEFTIWREITSFNFLLLHKGSKKLKTTHNQGLNFIISNCFPAKVIFGKSNSESLQIHQRKSHSRHVLQYFR